ncbi:unnamed protein product [Owenia fusiformis]|uniref:Uncharacterized protein n=1 Tax=Owenia fusiformis TaxID=6347 RepID=A0A8J1TWB9_OWEFU|nr:unnamed protein product [Owenia fusiformis]
MGGNSSCPLPQYSCCIPHKNPNFCRENRLSTPKIKNHKRNMSATFNLTAFEANDTLDPELMNINTASEEQLMTLPGINRSTAHNIIDYRRQIGGFKKVEDLALVSGVGATKLTMIRFEICVGNKKTSRGSTPRDSNPDLTIVEESRPASRIRSAMFNKINVNTSNVFQLMKVKGIGQNIAENIVDYRERKGQFRSIDELVKVKGIGHALLSAIRTQVCISHQNTTPSHGNHSNGILPNSSHSISNTLNRPRTNDTSKSSNDDIANRDATERLTASEQDIITLFRPVYETIPKRMNKNSSSVKYKRNNKTVIRLATWNIERCGLDKITNPGVLETICLTILENGLSLIAFQELAHREILERICKELNDPVLPNVRRWRGHKGQWESKTSGVCGRMFQAVEYNGFIYDTSQEIDITQDSMLEQNGHRRFSRSPYLTYIKAGSLDFIAVSVHLKATGLQNQDLSMLKEEIGSIDDVVVALQERLPGEKDLVILGDFNLPADAADFNVLRNEGYSSAIQASDYTNISRSNPDGSRNYDNIWSSYQMRSMHTGHSGTIRHGLSHPLIPDNWTWGGLVSDHVPVWTELYTNVDLDSGIDDAIEGLEGITLTTPRESQL